MSADPRLPHHLQVSVWDGKLEVFCDWHCVRGELELCVTSPAAVRAANVRSISGVTSLSDRVLHTVSVEKPGHDELE